MTPAFHTEKESFSWPLNSRYQVSKKDKEECPNFQIPKLRVLLFNPGI
jgi:hypothetical protein